MIAAIRRFTGKASLSNDGPHLPSFILSPSSLASKFGIAANAEAGERTNLSRFGCPKRLGGCRDPLSALARTSDLPEDAL
jgi:hypothetical protein